MERSTCVSAAKLTIASQPAGGAGDSLRVGDVAWLELVLDAVEVLLAARVGQLVEHDDLVPAETSRLTKWLPMNPQPPVTRTRTP